MSDNCSGERGLSHDMHVLVSGTCPACAGSSAAPAAAIPAAVRTSAGAEQGDLLGVETHGPNVLAITRYVDGMIGYATLSGPGLL